MSLNNIRVYILAGFFALLLIGAVLLVYSSAAYEDKKTALYASAKVVFAIDALKDRYDFDNDEKLILDKVNKYGLKGQLTFSKSSATVGEYKVEAADPVNGWNYLKDILRSGFKLSAIDVTQNPDHRINIYLKVEF